MILQNFVFPKLGVCSEGDLYCRFIKQGNVDFDQGTIVLPAGGKVIFDTYFNSFLCDRWVKYTSIKNLILELTFQGRGIVTVYRKSIRERELICWVALNSTTKSSKRITLVEDILELYGILHIEYEALDDSSVLGAAFITDAVPMRCISLGLVITTFKREQYVKNNLLSLQKKLFDVLLSQQLHVYVIDNGQTLDLPNTDRVTIIPSANYGGAGGFARGMLEIERNSKHTHVIFCDDDAIYEPESFMRLYAFLSLAKDADVCVGGSMFRFDQPTIMHESGAIYYKGKYFLNKHKLDMANIESTVTFNSDEYALYWGWWFFAFPVKFSQTVGYPLPFFFKADDIEFAWRLKEENITTTDLNGVCVWHEPFERKSATTAEYYRVRNEAIMRLIHEKNISMLAFISWIVRQVAVPILTYRYNLAEMMIQGYADAFKGPDFLKSINPAKFHAELTKKQQEKLLPITSDLLVISKYNRPVCRSKLKLLIMMLTLNGMLLPSFLINKARGPMSKGYVIEPLHSRRLTAIFRKEEVLYIDIDTKMGYLVHRDSRKFWGSLMALLKLIVKVVFSFKKTQRLYQAEFPSMITRDFWEKYFAMDSDLE